MLSLLLLLPTAFATDMTCTELQHMVEIGLPHDAIIAAMQYMTLPAEELACMRASGIPAEVLAAAEQLGASPSAPSESSEPAPPITTQTIMQPIPFVVGAGSDVPGDPCALARLMVSLPDPGAAAALSGTVGFGTGHFYAEQPGTGLVFLVLEGLAAGLLIGALSTDVADLDATELEARQAVTRAGAGLLVLGRSIDTVTAPASARRTGRARLDACGR